VKIPLASIRRPGSGPGRRLVLRAGVRTTRRRMVFPMSCVAAPEARTQRYVNERGRGTAVLMAVRSGKRIGDICCRCMTFGRRLGLSLGGVADWLGGLAGSRRCRWRACE
jgi:hypothetical protein